MIVRLTHTARRASVSEADKGVAMDVLNRADLPFPESLPEFQRLFPDDTACATYLEKARWGEGFACPNCGVVGEPFRIATRPGVLTCRACRRQTGLTVGTVMERSHTPLSVWFWAAYLVASQTPGMSAVQFQRQLGLTRYETAFGILLQAYLNEFTFRFNRRFYPFNAFRSLLGIAGDATAPTYAGLYSGEWQHPRCSGCLR